MSKKINREQSGLDSRKSSLSKRSRKSSLTHGEQPKIRVDKLSQALYHHQLKASNDKVILYDEFESDSPDIDGAMTSRYLPLETIGDGLQRCQKVQNLAQKKKGRGKDESQKRLSDARQKKKENKNQLNLRMTLREDRFSGAYLVSVKDS